jgi:hypothetical protein
MSGDRTAGDAALGDLTAAGLAAVERTDPSRNPGTPGRAARTVPRWRPT